MKRLLFLFALLAACHPIRVTTVQISPKHITADTTVREEVAYAVPDSTGFLTLQNGPIRTGQVMRYGFIDPTYRDSVLAKTWKDTIQVERGYCVTKWSVVVQDRIDALDPRVHVNIDSTFIVWDMEEVKKGVLATTASIFFDCPHGMPRAHSHPPNSCDDEAKIASCKIGGWDAYQCQPSENDLLNIIWYGSPFGINICGMHQVRFFYPSDYLSQRWKKPPERPTPPKPGGSKEKNLSGS